MLLFCK